jgi:hypothetical protein
VWIGNAEVSSVNAGEGGEDMRNEKYQKYSDIGSKLDHDVGGVWVGHQEVSSVGVGGVGSLLLLDRKRIHESGGYRVVRQIPSVKAVKSTGGFRAVVVNLD